MRTREQLGTSWCSKVLTGGRLASGLAIVGLLLAGCGDASAGAPPPTSAPQPSPTPSYIADGCIPAGDGAAVKIPAADHTIPAVIYGHGSRGVVLTNQSDQPLCQWKEFAPLLAKAGYQVITWDYGADTPENELRTVAAALRKRGADKLVLIGASKGAKATLVAAQSIPSVAGVISLSGEARTADGIEVSARVAKLTMPVLFVTARHDAYGAASAARKFMAVSPSRDKHLLTVDGNDHGVDLLAGSHGDDVRTRIMGFLQARLAG